MPNPNQFTEDNLIAMIRTDCHQQAQMAGTKLSEVIECLGGENHLGALGALIGLDEEIVCLKVSSRESRSLPWAKKLTWIREAWERAPVTNSKSQRR